MLFKKIIYIVFILIMLAILAYWLQPLKKGDGADHSFHYELVPDWPQLPPGFILGNPTGLDIDSAGNLYIFHRANRAWPLTGAMPGTPIAAHTVLVLDAASGKLLHSWGGGRFVMPHGLTLDHSRAVWLTDVGLHQVFKCSASGELLLQLGTAGVPGNDSLHFNKPTDIAIGPNGAVYVSDGYGNSRIMEFTPGGKFVRAWGSRGNAAGQFNTPHAIDADAQGQLFVADRENNRVQVFDSTGHFIRQYQNKTFGNMCSVCAGDSGRLIMADDVSFLKLKHRGSDVLVADTAGEVQQRSGRSGNYNGLPGWFHDVVTDNAGNIYVGDILNNKLLKFRRVRSAIHQE